MQIFQGKFNLFLLTYCIIEKLYLSLYQQTITNIKAMKTKLNSNEDFQIWYSNQVKKYGSVWSVHSFGVTNVPIEYPCVVLGYEDTANMMLFYDFVYLSDFPSK